MPLFEYGSFSKDSCAGCLVSNVMVLKGGGTFKGWVLLGGDWVMTILMKLLLLAFQEWIRSLQIRFITKEWISTFSSLLLLLLSCHLTLTCVTAMMPSTIIWHRKPSLQPNRWGWPILGFQSPKQWAQLNTFSLYTNQLLAFCYSNTK